MAKADPTPDSEGISLDELAQAFAQVMGAAPKSKTSGEPPTESVPERSPGVAAGTTDAGLLASEAELPADDDSCPISPRSILEAMLFVGDRDNRPLSAARAAELMRGVEAREIPGLIDELNQRYRSQGCPYAIVREGDGYRLALRKQFRALRDRFLGRIREARLSQAAIDVLAIVAYQQPLTTEQVGKLRGKPSRHILSQLVRRRLLRVERQPGQRRRVQYFVTDRFLELFGMQTLADLPQSEELDRQ